MYLSNRLLVSLLLSCPLIPRFTFAQSAADSRAMIQMKRRQIEAEAAYNAAKKIHIDEFEKFKDQIPDRHKARQLELSKLEAKQVGRLDFYAASVVQVVGPEDAILRIAKTFVWLKGYKTKNLADGNDVRVLGYVKIGPTKTYETNTGTNTVFEIELLPLKETLELLRQEQLKEFPIWHSKAGTTVQARFLRYAGRKIHLEKPDGSTLQVALSAFTDEDADKIRALIKSSRK